MAVHVALYQVFADRHGNLELAVGIASDPLLRLYEVAVDHKLHAVHGDIGVEVGHLTAHGERRHVGEVVAVERQRAVADEAVARQGRELVDAASRRDGIGRAAAHEGYAADDVLTVLVGHGIARQLVVDGHDTGCRDVVAHLGVTAIGHVVGVGSIEDVAVQTLVHRPVEGQALLPAIQHAVGIALLLLVVQHVVPYAHLGEVATEGFLLSDTIGTANREESQLWYLRSRQCLGFVVSYLYVQLTTRPADCQQRVGVVRQCQSCSGLTVDKLRLKQVVALIGVDPVAIPVELIA